MSLIRRLATARTATDALIVARYNPAVSMAEVFEGGRWVASTKSTVVPTTKKSDLETGEDQKGD